MDPVAASGRSTNNGFFLSGDFLDDDLDERDLQSDSDGGEEPSARPDADREGLPQSPLSVYTSHLIRNAKAEASARETERRKRALVRYAEQPNRTGPLIASPASLQRDRTDS